MARQLAMRLFGWGGARPGAGRKRTKVRPGVPHRTRPRLTGREPAHVTLRVVPGLPSLRTERLHQVVRPALAKGAASRPGFRIVHHSVQRDHLHLVVEAESRLRLSRGIQGLCVRLARAVNRRLGRKGRLFDDRFHAHVLRTLAEVRHAVAYVLHNFRRHAVKARARGAAVDVPASTWKDPRSSARGAWTVPRTWLLRQVVRPP